MPKTMYQAVREFHEATGLPVLDAPIRDEKGQYTDKEWGQIWSLRTELVREEYMEFRKAMQSGNLVEIADAIMDLHYVLSGTSVSLGIPEDACFTEVHRSNMSKLQEDGTALKREDGKILKSDQFSPPDLHKIIYG